MGRDWLGRNRQTILAMAKNWRTVLLEDAPDSGSTPKKKWQAWGLSQEAFTQLGVQTAEAEAALTTALAEETRTKVTTQICRDTFETLIKLMRDIRRRYFHIPPLTRADFVSMGLPLPDERPAPPGSPTATVTVIPSLRGGYHELHTEISVVSGDLTDRENKATFHIRYGAFPAAAPVPALPRELPDYVFTKRLKNDIIFEYGDSGKTGYFCVRIENGKKKGEWGPIVHAKIP